MDEQADRSTSVTLEQSEQLAERAGEVLPGSVAGNASHLSPHPIFFQEATGSKLVDEDGNTFVDLLIGGGPAILGHSRQEIIRAVQEQLETLVSGAIANEHVVELAEKINEHMPHMEMMRFVNSGSEGIHFALKAARAYTGNSKVCKVEGHYNGQIGSQLVSLGEVAGPDHAPKPAPGGAGMAEGTLSDTVVIPFNDMTAIDIIREHGNELAAVFLEPISCFGLGVVEADTEWLKAVREVTKETDTLLIFDECVTGFRVSMGGAVEYFDNVVEPDLTMLGKPIGGQFPIGAFGGREQIMDQVVTPEADPLSGKNKIFQSGTFSGNPVSAFAGLKTLELMEETNALAKANETAASIQTGFQNLAEDHGLACDCKHVASFGHVHFTDEPIINKRNWMREADPEMQGEWSMTMIDNGVYLPPNHPWLVGAKHSQADVDTVLEAADEAFANVK